MDIQLSESSESMLRDAMRLTGQNKSSLIASLVDTHFKDLRKKKVIISFTLKGFHKLSGIADQMNLNKEDCLRQLVEEVHPDFFPDLYN